MDGLENTQDDKSSFQAIQDRIFEIADIVDGEDISIDEALSLYEEAVKLGMQACNVSEQDLFPLQEDEVEGGSADNPPSADAQDGAMESEQAESVGISTDDAGDSAAADEIA